MVRAVLGLGGVLAMARCAALVGVEAVPVRVEADVARRGMPGINIVGLAEAAVRESQVRIRAALSNCGYDLPAGRITVNLAPADLPKGGSGFDLAIALALLAGSGVLPPERLSECLAVGELSLRGELRPIRGALSYALCARRCGVPSLILPSAVAPQACAVSEVRALAATDLPAVVGFLRGEGELQAPALSDLPQRRDGGLDLRDVRGQQLGKRALEIAAAGGHNLLFIGPPGMGKTMLAQRLPGIMPAMDMDEAIETTAVWSVAGLLPPRASLVRERPFRAPHHTATLAGLVGGGTPLRPGEVSLAHNGVLMLDELPEFKRSVLESLRQPLEQGEVVLARAGRRVSFPASVLVVATMNPCPCGMLGNRRRACRCSPLQVAQYRGRVSGPLLDRIDLHVEVPAVTAEEIESAPEGEQSGAVRARIESARKRQAARYAGTAMRCNADLTAAAIDRFCRLEPEAARMAARAADTLGLSARGYSRMRKVARTIADLAQRSDISAGDLAEAMALRAMDRSPRW